MHVTCVHCEYVCDVCESVVSSGGLIHNKHVLLGMHGREGMEETRWEGEYCLTQCHF